MDGQRTQPFSKLIEDNAGYVTCVDNNGTFDSAFRLLSPLRSSIFTHANKFQYCYRDAFDSSSFRDICKWTSNCHRLSDPFVSNEDRGSLSNRSYGYFDGIPTDLCG